MTLYLYLREKTEDQEDEILYKAGSSRPASAMKLDTVVNMIDSVKDEMTFFREKVFIKPYVFCINWELVKKVIYYFATSPSQLTNNLYSSPNLWIIKIVTSNLNATRIRNLGF